MRKRRLCIVILVFLAIATTGCTETTSQYSTLVVDDYNGIDLNMIDHYEIDIDFDPESKIYSGNQIVTYVNNTEVKLQEIYFHLYPNAYRDLETAPILFEEEIKNGGYKPGYIEIEKLEVDGEKTDFQIQGEGNTILKINLPNTLDPKQKVKIDFKYEAKLPLNIDRFGYGENVFNFGNWYPIACVYDINGWNTDPYYNIGDPFYSNIANYDVTIIVPEDVIVATSGNVIEEKVKRDKKTYIIEGRLIRDFAWVASSDFIVEESTVEGIAIKLYALKDNQNIADFASKVGSKTIKMFSTLYGKYPYGVYSIVMTDFPSGMEYPGIVFINKDYYNESGKDYLEQVIVHETAHQWWYGVVGNDQVDEAWLDESLATYSEVIYMYNTYGRAKADDYYNYTCELAYEYGKDYLEADEIINKPLDEFEGWNDYGLLVYTKGAMFINEIKEEFGMETLYKILSRYYETYRFHNGNTRDFIDICQQITNTSFKDKVDQWLYDK
ncbi:M1 family metallopeptidase [Schnuerera sp. xch1]|uniref:M1 family metallopeptidase n=1 Tax=Schnuerera sp. xch1 TaxID=2874283 RepID=UPI001CC013D2|nr:M1 family metallopeptidase [Schnuerera sp. xch1]